MAAEAAAFRVAFDHAVMFAQSRRVDPVGAGHRGEGEALSEREPRCSTSASARAAGWLETYAPESARFEVVRDRLPATLG